MFRKNIAIVSGNPASGKSTLAMILSKKLKSENQTNLVVDLNPESGWISELFGGRQNDVHEFFGKSVAKIDTAMCIHCNMCKEACTFDAIDNKGLDYEVDLVNCTGCDKCGKICPLQGIEMIPKSEGRIFQFEDGISRLISGRLFGGSTSTAKMLKEIRKIADEMAQTHQSEIVLTDNSHIRLIPGLKEASSAIILASTSIGGKRGFQRAVQSAKLMQIPFSAVLNHFPDSPKYENILRETADELDVEFDFEINFDENYFIDPSGEIDRIAVENNFDIDNLLYPPKF